MAKSTVAVRFVGDVANLKRSIGEIDGGMDKFKKGVKVAAAAAGTALVAFGASAVKAGSDLNETLSKSNTVFGDNAKEIEEWSNTAADSFGQSKTEALAAASSFGNMFIQLGIGSDQAADMSTQMTELASDFASFHNADITQVIEAQSAAFRGEYDALQRFVPTINAAAVEQQALADTGKATTKELTAQEKALAVQTLMMEGAGDAMGDFDRTSDSLANRQRILAAQFENVQAEVGTALIPVLLKAADAGVAIIGFFKGLPGPLKTAAAGLAAATAAVVALNIAIGLAKKSTSNLGGVAKALGGMGGAAAAIPFAAVGAGLLAWQTESRKAQYNLEDLTDALTNTTAAGEEQSEAYVKALAVTDDLDRAVSDVADTNVKAAERMVELAESIGLPKAEIEALRQIIENKRASDVGAAQDQAAYTGELAAATDQTGEMATETEGLIEYLNAHEEALQGVYDATLAQFDANLGYRQSIDQVEGSLAALATTQKEHGTDSEEYRDALLDTEDALLGQAAGAVKVWEDTTKAAGGTLNATDKTKIYRGELIKLRDGLAPGNPLRARLQSYIDQLNTIPANKKTVLTLEERRVSTGAKRNMAAGGRAYKDHAYEVGEQGRELFVPSENGTIVPSSKLGPRPAAAGGVNVNLNISIPPTMDAGAAGQAITEALAAYVRRNGANDLRLLLGV